MIIGATVTDDSRLCLMQTFYNRQQIGSKLTALTDNKLATRRRAENLFSRKLLIFFSCWQTLACCWFSTRIVYKYLTLFVITYNESHHN